MTNQEAIRILEFMKSEMLLSFDNDRKKALNMAIEALKEQPEHSQNTSSKQPDLETFGVKTGETCEDVISRQDAIDAVEFGITYAKVLNKETGEVMELFKKSNEELQKAVDRIEALPSAQPEIIRCKDCKHIQKWRSEESAKKFGQIYECARNVLNCPKPEDFCSRAEGRTDG